MARPWWIAAGWTLVVGAAACGPGENGTTTRPAEAMVRAPDRLKVVTYNTWGCRGGIEKIIETLREQEPDIVFLQEVGRQPNAAKDGEKDPPARIAKALGMHVVSARALGVPVKQRCDEAILSRFELTEGKAHAKDDGGWVFAVQARIKAKGRPLYLLSVHTHSTYRLDARHLYESSKARLAEVTRLLDIVRKLDGDVLIAGDFNAASWMPEYFLLTREWADLGSASKEDKLSFPSWKPAVRIDYVFGRGEFVGRSYGVLTARWSDHLPVAAVLEREKAASSRPTAEKGPDQSGR